VTAVRSIPQSNPGAGFVEHRSALEEAATSALASGWYILGKQVSAFESEFASYIGVKQAVGVANGTDAVELCLRGCDVRAGDIVFTVSHTAVATVAAIERAGAVPVLVDIDPATYTIDPARLEDAVQSCRKRGQRVAAVVVVHLYGQAADMDAISAIASRHGLTVIEDCAQAHGARWRGRRVGSFGAASAFSFYPTKNLGAFGDGGAVCTNDDAIGQRVRSLREYGWQERYISSIAGMNSRLDELHAAMLRVRLPHLDHDNGRRRDIATRYSAAISAGGVVPPQTRQGCTHVFHQYVVRSQRRDALREFLQTRGVGTGIHYPVPIHKQPAYDGRIATAGDLTETERAAREIASLPMFPQLTSADVDQVCDALKAWEAAGA
jgi:dTDP-4-amino-4,6-dideoxygalactose transaminase